MLNLIHNIFSTITIHMADFFNQLFIEPSKVLLQLTAEYFSQANYSFVSIFGIIVAFLLFAQAAKGAYSLILAAIQHVILNYKAKKRREINAIKARERKKLEERLAYEQEFEELYNKYAN